MSELDLRPLASVFSKRVGDYLDLAAHGTRIEILDGQRGRRVRAVLMAPEPGCAADLSTIVYRLFDAQKRLLYVGRTQSLDNRLYEHRSKPWWPEVETHTAEVVPSSEAADAERRAIQTEHPKYNRMHNWPAPEPEVPADV